MADPLFRDANQPFPTDSSVAVALGDLDGDGDLDAYVSNRTEASPVFDRIYLNDGRGRFIDKGLQIDVRNAQIALADLDGDGDLDVFASTNQAPGVPAAGDEDLVLFNRGDGRMVDSGQRLGLDEGGHVALADVDGNGTIDAVVGNLGGDNAADRPGNQIYLNDGTGYFVDSGQRLGANSSRGVAVGDLDGNGTVDAFFGDEDGSRVFLNPAGDGRFVDSGQLLGIGLSFDVALADLDNDGDLDAYVAKAGRDEVWRNEGNGSFALENFLDTGTSLNVELGDLNGDGWIDAFVVSADGPDRIMLNNGAGLLVEDALLPGDRGAGLALGDLDGDGDLDAFVANNGLPVGDRNRVFFNQTTEPTGTVLIDPASRVMDGWQGGFEGLAGEFYERDDPVFAIDSLDFADRVIAAGPPDGTFVAFTLDYPAGRADTLFIPNAATYLGEDAATMKPTSQLRESVSPSIWNFTGWIEIDGSHDLIDNNATIDVAFGLGSDDGSRLTIGGSDVVTIDTFAIPTFPGVSGIASFAEPGLYPIEIVHYDHFGGIGLEVSSSIAGGNSSGGPGETVGIVPSNILFHSLEPDIGEPLPLLVNRKELAPDNINGVDPERFMIGESGDAAITFLAEDGGFASALGAYLIGDDNTIIDPTIVFESMITDTGKATIAAGETLHLSELFDAETLAGAGRFGLFLVANGANGNLPDLAGGELAFLKDGEAAKTTDRVPDLVHVADDGRVTQIDGRVMHATDDGSPNPLSNALNVGKSAQAVSGIQNGEYVVSFEDKSYGRAGSDDDFNDVQIVVDNGTLESVVMSLPEVV